MDLEQLLRATLQIQGVPSLERLPQNELTQQLGRFLVDLRTRNKSAKTLKAYAQFGGYFIRFLDSLPANLTATNAQEVKPDHFKLWILRTQQTVNRFGRPMAPETVSAYYRAVHSWFNWLQEDRVLTEEGNPVRRVKIPKVPKKLVRPWPKDVVDRVFQATSLDTSFVGVRNRAMALILFDTLVREFELAGMKLSDLYINQGLIRVMGKGSKERIVKMGESAQKALLAYLFMRRNRFPRDTMEAVWIGEEGRPMKQSGIDIAIRRISERARIPRTEKRGAHSYRHTGATNYLRNDGNIKTLQELLGHENIATTQKYTYVLGPEKLSEDHRKAGMVDNWK